VRPQGAKNIASSSKFQLLDESSDEEELPHMQHEKLSVARTDSLDDVHFTAPEPEIGMCSP
jgi:hypothetical protein